MKKIWTAFVEWYTQRHWVGLDRRMIESWARLRDMYKERGRL
jgi:hypothetical protein